MIIELLEWLALLTDAVGVSIMLAGFLLALWQFLSGFWSQTVMDEIAVIQKVRCRLGSYLVLSLEFMIVSDLLHSVMTQALEDLYFLAALVLLRTIIGYFLNKEIQELKEQVV